LPQSSQNAEHLFSAEHDHDPFSGSRDALDGEATTRKPCGDLRATPSRAWHDLAPLLKRFVNNTSISYKRAKVLSSRLEVT
jgi:hypothetical protein